MVGFVIFPIRETVKSFMVLLLGKTVQENRFDERCLEMDSAFQVLNLEPIR